ncbi:MAG: twin transmembrane helix small protein [Sphingomonadales bacterium]|nr:twin transmembrane helix small protein [Sphingomonadales bacterium]
MTFLLILIGLALLAVLAILGVGVFAMAQGGEFNRKYGNKLMQARVAAQLIAVLLIFLFMAVAAGS